jgi:hypothetical protein
MRPTRAEVLGSFDVEGSDDPTIPCCAQVAGSTWRGSGARGLNPGSGTALGGVPNGSVSGAILIGAKGRRAHMLALSPTPPTFGVGRPTLLLFIPFIGRAHFPCISLSVFAFASVPKRTFCCVRIESVFLLLKTRIRLMHPTSDGDIRTVGCSVAKLIPDAEHLELIREAVTRVHKATIFATELLNLHIRRRPCTSSASTLVSESSSMA